MSRGLLKPEDLVGNQLIRYVSVRIASPHKLFGTLVWNRIDQVTSNRCRFFFSVKSFCWVYIHEDSCIIPSDCKYEFQLWLKYSLALSILNFFKLVPNRFLIMAHKFFKVSYISDFCFNRKIHIHHVQSFVNVTNHLFPQIIEGTWSPNVAMNSEKIYQFFLLEEEKKNVIRKFTHITFKSVRGDFLRHNREKKFQSVERRMVHSLVKLLNLAYCVAD